MATSGSVDFSQNAREIVEDAHYLIGAHDIEQTLPNEYLTLGLRVLNRMAKAWQTKGIHIWRYAEGSFATVADTESYTMGTGGSFTTRPLKITSMRHVANSIDTPMIPLTRQEYFDQPNKATSGKPSSFYYDPQGGKTATGTLYIWPTDSAVNSLEFTYLRQFDDFDASANDPDFPQEWLDCLVHNLALKLAPYYGVTDVADLRLEAERLLDEAQGYSREDPGSVYIGIDYEGM